MIEVGNPMILTSENRFTEDDIIEGLRYSSCSIMLPALFCFYQGIELLLKGFIALHNNNKYTHDFENLITGFKMYYSNSDNFIKIIEKYVNDYPFFIKEYCKKNNIKNTTELYHSLRYPDIKYFETVDYSSLEYDFDGLFIPKLTELSEDINLIMKYSVKLFRDEIH